MIIIINAEIRNIQGKGASRRLRTVNKIPSIIYGGIRPSIPIELNHDKIWNLQTKGYFYNKILTILLNDKKEEIVKVQAIQRHAFKPKLTHIDFIRI